MKIKNNRVVKGIYVKLFNRQVRIHKDFENYEIRLPREIRAAREVKTSRKVKSSLVKLYKMLKFLLSSQNNENTLINEMKKANNPLFYIYGKRTDTFDVSSNIKEYIFKNKVKTVFQYPIFFDSFIKSDYRWSFEGNITFFSYTEREDDDLMYETCQNLTRNLLYGVNLDNKSLNDDFQIMKETITLQVADFYISVLRSVVMLLEECKKNQHNKVILYISDVNFAFVLSDVLKINGIESTIMKADSFSKKKILRIKDLYKNESLDKFILIPNRNVNLDDNFRKLKNKIKKDAKFIFCISKVNNNAFFNTVLQISEYIKEYNFFTIDVFENKNNLKNVNTANNLEFTCIGRNNYFLEKKDMKLTVLNIIAGLKNKIEEKFVYQEFNFGNSFYKYGLNNIITQSLNSLYYFKLFDKLFKERRPHSILVCPSRTIEARAAILAGRKNSITSFDLQSGGAIFKTRRFWKIEADYLLCTDAFSKKIYHDLYNLREEKILLVGSPAVDFNVEKYKKGKIKQNKRRIFLALQPLSLEVNLKIVNTCLEAIKDMKDTELTVGFHPRDEEMNKRNIIENAQDKFNVVEKDSLKELMFHDICITYYSFMGVEAFAMGCKLISLNVLEHKKWPYRLKDLGIAEEAYNADELKELLLDDKERDLDESSIIFRDGLSVERISKAIREL